MRDRIDNDEILFNENEILLSTTDLESHVTYANPKFCEIAGYSLDEMRGKPHNLVRHSDMPKAAFANLWQYIKAGDSWMGPVKNRCKNGKYYWVNAFVTPIRNSRNEIVEYQSVRTKPQRDVVERANIEYKKINEGKRSKALKSPVDYSLFVFMGFVVSTLMSFAAVWMSGLNPYVIATSAVLTLTTGMFGVCRKKYLALVARARSNFDNSIMAYLYSGTNDISGFLTLALAMQEAKLKAVVGRVNDVTERVNQNASESSNSGRLVTDLLDKQNVDVMQIATAMDEFTATITDLAANVGELSLAAKSTEQQNIEGKDSVMESLKAIQELDEQLQNASNEVQRLVDGNSQINNILNKINEIAEQTNLLALNAAIEAARAGEQGRGFAVVADEVRHLAVRTQESTEEIGNLIGELNTTSNNAQKAMAQGISLSSRCVELANASGGSLDSILENVTNLSDLNSTIATSIEEQSVVAEQIAMNVNQVKELAEESGQHGQNSQHLSDELLTQVEEQSSLVRQFI